jgi:MFS family permease
MGAAFFAGGVTTPLYALLLAYTNDNVPAEDMPAISGGLVFTFGLGAIIGPIAVGLSMDAFGPFAFWIVLGGTFSAIVTYALYRMSQSEATPVSETDAYVNLVPTASPVAVEDAANWAAENADADEVVR